MAQRIRHLCPDRDKAGPTKQSKGDSEMKRIIFFTALLTMGLLASFSPFGGQESQAASASQLKVFSVEKGDYFLTDKVIMPEAEWKKLLTPDQYRILRQKGTEPSFSGETLHIHAKGVYRCAGCGLDLFSSTDKYDSRTGWPSFTRPVAPENVQTAPDNSFFTRRTEVLCPRCGGHLGHVFEDGPEPTGLRYCMNSLALQFVSLEQGGAE